MKNVGKIFTGFFAVIGCLTVLTSIFEAVCCILSRREYITNGVEDNSPIPSEKNEEN